MTQTDTPTTLGDVGTAGLASPNEQTQAIKNAVTHAEFVMDGAHGIFSWEKAYMGLPDFQKAFPDFLTNPITKRRVYRIHHAIRSNPQYSGAFKCDRCDRSYKRPQDLGAHKAKIPD